jgi:predicted ATPase/DNA-binding XRE family transcriptional regulator
MSILFKIRFEETQITNGILCETSILYSASSNYRCPSGTQTGTYFGEHVLAEVSFGVWLKRQRKALGMTQEQLAQQVFCSTSALKKIEEGLRRPSAQIAERLAEIFNIPANEKMAFIRFARGGEWRPKFSNPSATAPWQTPSRITPSNIPATVISLIGRENEIAEIQAYLQREEIRLLTLIGPPGIGKTRLGIETARTLLPNFTAGVYFVALAPLENPSLLAATVAQALGFVGVRNITAEEQLKEGIGDKEILIVLDNCEHLIEEAAELASFLLSACSRLKILATSRESLRIPGECLYPVPAFDLPDVVSTINIETASNYPALTLFAERARAVRPDFALTPQNIQTVASICAQLDGLPLAIELIAARMRLMSPQTLLERLNEQFILSADGMRSPSARQKTLNNSIGWSYNLLSKEEQKLFIHLSVFSGGFTLETAEAMFSQIVSEKSVSDLVASLLDKSLLQRTFKADGEAYFSMLVTIQHFAMTQLRSAGKESELRDLHLAYFLELAEKGDREIHGHKQLEWLGRFSDLSDNFRSALEWAIDSQQTISALNLVRRLQWFWFMRGDFILAQHWIQKVLDLPGVPSFPNAQADALIQYAYHSAQLGNNEFWEGKPYIEQALSIARAHDDLPNINMALTLLGWCLAEEGNFADAVSIGREAMTYFQNTRDDWRYANAALLLGIQSSLADWSIALPLFQQALSIFRKLGDTYFQSVACRYIGRAHTNLGNLADGVSALCESLSLAAQLDNTFQIALILWRGFSETALHAGEVMRAVTLISASMKMFQSIGAWTEQDDLRYEKELAPCRAELGVSAFQQSWNDGYAMTPEDAIQYALEAKLS